MKLYMQPMEYSGRRLQELGQRVVSVLYPVLDDCVVNEELPLSDVCGYWCRLNSLFRYNIRATDFLRSLSTRKKDTDVILGITQVFLIGDNKQTIFGQADPGIKAAVVSVAKSEFGERNSDNHIEKLVIEALHELGHVFGLKHHNKREIKTKNGWLCPMTNAHYTAATVGKITWAEYISLRDPSAFCAECNCQLDKLHDA